MTKRDHSHEIQPLADYGFFGPDSITWKVFSHPTALTVGFQRTAMVEMFEPFLMAAVNDTNAVMERPKLRYERTLQYVATIAFGDTASVLKASDVLFRIHRRIVGQEPISGGTYDANDPQSQLWIHLTQWQSVLLCYEVFGPGKLSAEEERQYWTECARAAEFQTIDPADVPRSRAEMRAYYARMQPVLAATVATQQHVEHILNSGDAPLSDSPRPVRLAGRLMRPVLRRATIATLPGWQRRMAGVKQNRSTDVLVVAVLRPYYAVLARSPRLTLKLAEQAAPRAFEVVAPAIMGIPPHSTTVSVSPAQAREQAGLRSPRELYAEHLADRVVAPAAAPRDDPGLLLSFG